MFNIDNILTGALPLLTAVVTYIFTRGENAQKIAMLKQEVVSARTENESDRLKNLQTEIETYRMLIEDLRTEINSLRERVEFLQSKLNKYVQQ